MGARALLPLPSPLQYPLGAIEGTVTVLQVLRRVRNATQSVPAVQRVYDWRPAPRAFALFRDGQNRIRYGSNAPRFAECLWIDPQRVEHFDLLFARRSRWNSGRVIEGDWPNDYLQPIRKDPILRTSISRWVEGLSWKATGEVERMERAIAARGPLHGCRTKEDILRRCADLDEVFATIQREGRLRTQDEVERNAFREMGGIGMHIGPGGVPIRAGNGRHRFAMALILQLPRIPVRVGLVHRSALPHLLEYRRP